MGLIKYLLKQIFSLLGFTVTRNNIQCSIKSRNQIIDDFKLSGALPWSSGYGEYKEDEITKAISNQKIIDKIFNSENLPEKFGVGLDERIIEYPWFFFSQVKGREVQAARYLDAGPVMNHSFVVNRARKLARSSLFHIITRGKIVFMN